MLVLIAWRPVVSHLEAAAFLLRFEGAKAEGFAGFGAHGVGRRPLSWDGGEGRLYLPDGVDDAPGVVLVHGVHPEGIDEPRLVSFAEAIASTGMAVLTPRMEGLSSYRVEPSAVPRIRDAASALADQLGGERVAVFGISFAGGLSLLAAADQAGGAPIGLVLSIGGHHDLHRVTRHYLGAPIEGPAGERPGVEPHGYGAGVLVHTYADELFPDADVERVRAILGLLLEDRWRDARARLDSLSPAARRGVEQVLARDYDGPLARELESLLDERREDLARVSPRDALHTVEVPVFLIHGKGDPVVPATETRWLAREVPAAHLGGVVVTDVLRHAEYEREPSWRERWELVHFMAEVLQGVRDLG